ncbi:MULTISPECIES: AAA family ATPase [unclassified Curtobacterium]|uniref:AAA family ATPase n=1 Tax=unclassified Curtobacterium TaxID=257496 RepID=UPI001AE573AE|nr:MULTISPECIES: AAA family ATPase [unclassified Curtobacterium]MBP1302732.1 energy-coupling factor transporter ATP-binding protein EcfA2 [Curtobacterium sp. 1310]MDT0211996.1 AAA family ATPase [Curtobacterium sp. BRD11]
MPRSEVLFVGGRSGVGKSTAAEALHDLLVAADVPHAVIEGDLLDLAHPAPHVAHPAVRLAERNLRAMWAAYRELGHHRLVFTNTVSVLEHERLAAAMGDDPVVTAVLLRASDATTAARLARRVGGTVPHAQLAHSTATAGRLDSAVADTVARVDTDGRSPLEIARRLASLTGWLPG